MGTRHTAATTVKEHPHTVAGAAELLPQPNDVDTGGDRHTAMQHVEATPMIIPQLAATNRVAHHKRANSRNNSPCSQRTQSLLMHSATSRPTQRRQRVALAFNSCCCRARDTSCWAGRLPNDGDSAALRPLDDATDARRRLGAGTLSFTSPKPAPDAPIVGLPAPAAMACCCGC